MQSLETMGGYKQWKQHQKKAVRVTFTDTWYGFLGKNLFMPLEFSGQKMAMLFWPGSESARMTFLDGDKRKGTSWGVQQWVTYKVDKAGKISWAKDDTVKFYVPTCQYFIYMPFYLADAQKLTYAGEKTLHGKQYDLVYATWGKWEPQPKIDQYMIWIRRDNKRIDFIEFTVRDKLNRIKVPVHMSDYRKVDGLLVAFDQKILNGINNLKDIGHNIKIEKIELVTKDASKLILPDPSRKGTK